MKFAKLLVLISFMSFSYTAFGYNVPGDGYVYAPSVGRSQGVIVQPSKGYSVRQRANYITKPTYREPVPVYSEPGSVHREYINENNYVEPLRVLKKQHTGFPKMYIGANLFYNYASFESKHLTNGIYDSSDPYSIDEFGIGQIGGAIYIGNKFDENWRLEGEIGWFGKHTETEIGATYNSTFSLNTPYLIANIIYDFSITENGGFFVGAGLGAAFPTTTIESAAFISGDAKEMAVSPMGALIVGWQYPINENFFFDIKYRLSAYNGTEHTRQFMTTTDQIYNFTNETGIVLNNGLSAGVRYEF